MQIIPTVDGQNFNRCVTAIKVLRGFVSIIGIKIDNKNTRLKDLIRLFNKQTTELELFLDCENVDQRLQEIVTAHSDVNIGKVYFYLNTPEIVDQQTTNIRIFGIQPGLIVDSQNYDKISIVNKFEYAVIIIANNPNYIDMYKHIKANDYKGSLILDFGATVPKEDTLKNADFDGIYFDITNNPRIKDTISAYRRIANSIY